MSDAGDSVEKMSLANGFGFGPDEDTTPTTNTPEVETDIPATQDSPAEVDAPTDDTSKEVEAVTVDKAEKARLEEAHKLIIDTIEDKFTDLNAGKLSPLELEHWFKENPEFADVANRAKRVKESYRRFIETPRETPTTEAPVIPEDKPLTIKDLQAYDQQREDALLKKQYEKANAASFEKYVTTYDIKGEPADKLRTVADTLYKANDEWSFDDALQAAHRALYDGKRTPVGLPAGSTIPQAPSASQEEKVDLSQRSQIISLSDFTS